ncbi:hypothetical protein AJ79_03272 [Helicocarpus griseus UAMH5409]|uniref:DUF7730 domain-containing protein n=1 Tax=Helicocarpus griseus UAMH5409 TaxID=1447875 RepID=A0A2B7XZ00_9EURO|nr:hypothetical protein AJ79_03272 [Helicocarpus griseus UAMH5409]
MRHKKIQTIHSRLHHRIKQLERVKPRFHKSLQDHPPFEPPVKLDLEESLAGTRPQDINTLCTDTDPLQAVRKSRFFKKLPPELRRQVYVLAFGNGVVHIDDCGSFKLARRPHFCPYAVGQRPPREDDCENIFEYQCTLRRYGSELIGVMGWLLSCRLAYAEAVDVLYSTNTLRIRGMGSLSRLPNYLPPGILERITSLELIPRVRLIAVPEELITSLPRSMFPNLRRLHLSVSGIEVSSWQREVSGSSDYGVTLEYNEAMETDAFLARADHLARKLLSFSRLQVFEISVGHETFQRFAEGLRGDEEAIVHKTPRQSEGERFWRSLDKVRVNENADVDAAAAAALDRNCNTAIGYWIQY